MVAEKYEKIQEKKQVAWSRVVHQAGQTVEDAGRDDGVVLYGQQKSSETKRVSNGRFSQE
jgi:tetrahydromethanopterin S-methyltransferase subunit G